MPWAPPAAELDAALTDGLARALPAGRLGGPLVAFREVDSTQTVVRRYAALGAPEGLVVVADHQTAGRGRRGRSWVAPPGTALLVSCLLRPKAPPDRWPAIGLAAACALAEALVTEAGIEPTLRWPNDVLLGERKLAGILTEAVPAENPFVVLGIGVNLLDPPGGWPENIAGRAISLAAAGRAVERTRLLAALLARLEAWYAVLLEEGVASVRRAWLDRGQLGGVVRTPTGPGTAFDLAADGALLVRLPDGTITSLRAAPLDDDPATTPGSVVHHLR